MALAAKCRVYRWEADASGGLRIARRRRTLQEKIAASGRVVQLGTWSGWYENNFILNFDAAHSSLESCAVAAGLSVARLVKGSSAEPAPRSQWQWRCRQLLTRPSQACTTRELSRSLSRLPLPPAPQPPHAAGAEGALRSCAVGAT